MNDNRRLADAVRSDPRKEQGSSAENAPATADEDAADELTMEQAQEVAAEEREDEGGYQ